MKKPSNVGYVQANYRIHIAIVIKKNGEYLNVIYCNIIQNIPAKEKPQQEFYTKLFNNEEDMLVKLVYEAVTLTSPTKEIYSILSVVGIKRTLEIA